MFKDIINLKVKAGNGGNGLTSFRHEKFMPFGGPDGGRGGNGGNIIFKGDKSLNNLYRLTSFNIIQAENGENGKSKNCYGKNGENKIINVPLGLIVKTKDNKFIAEIKNEVDEVVIAHGGRGGRGNYSFKSSKNQAPDYSEKGKKGEELELVLELKLIAEIGLLGFPNVGKSTFLKQITNANPKIANYPFTTLNPNIAVMDIYDKQITIADIPGIIEGANKGLGLGFEFLRHIQRCKVFVHIIDSFESNPYKNYEIIRNELLSYDKTLLERPEIIFLNKSELLDDKRKKEILKDFAKKRTNLIMGSNFDSETIKKLKAMIYEKYLTAPDVIYDKTIENYERNKALNNFDVKIKDGIYYVSGELVEDLFHRVDFNKDDSVLRFSYQLREIGVDEKLKAMGIKDGDTVNILNYEFIYEY